MDSADTPEILEEYVEEKIKKSPKEIVKTALTWVIIILFCREIFTNTKENAIVTAPYFFEPQQTMLSNSEKEKLKFKIKLKDTEALIMPQAKYEMSARVVAKSRILGDGISELVPYDIGLVWGDLMKDKNYRKIRIHQYQRWIVYSISQKNMDILNKIDVPKYIANNHLIPANKNVLKGIRGLRKYDKVYLKGYLVYSKISYKKAPPFDYNSSLSREDTGDHACEIFYVTKIVSARGTWE